MQTHHFLAMGALCAGLLSLTIAQPNSSSTLPNASATTLLGTGHPAANPAVSPVHCQVPCGVYTDKMRIEMLLEDCATIEKAMTEMQTEPEGALARQQFVRWVQTKESHAQKIQDTIAQYWLAQRIKPLAADATPEDTTKYHAQLTHLHHITVLAMKCKQGLDVANVEGLRATAKTFSATYFSKEDMEHLSGHHWK